MSFRLTYAEVGERLGKNAYDLSAQLADKTRQFACQIWSLYPDWVTGNQSLGTSFARGLMTSVCQQDEPPPPYQGGNCPVAYHAFGTYYSKNFSSGGCDVIAFWRTIGSASGTDISSWQPRQISSSDPRYSIKRSNGGNIFIRQITFEDYTSKNTTLTGGVPVSFRNKDFACLNQTNNPVGDRVRVTDLVRLDGLPDDCPPLYPVYPPSQPPSVISNQYDIQVDANTTITYNVSLKRSGDNNFQFPLVFSWNDFDVALDAGGFTFDVDINPTISPPDADNPGGEPKPPILPPKAPPRGGGGGNGVPIDSPEDYTSEEIPVEEELEEQDGEVLDYITILVTETPQNAPREEGRPGDDIIYPGFAEFKSASYNFPRTPLHFARNVLRAPEGANGFAVRIYPGFKAIVTKYYRKEEV